MLTAVTTTVSPYSSQLFVFSVSMINYKIAFTPKCYATGFFTSKLVAGQKRNKET